MSYSSSGHRPLAMIMSQPQAMAISAAFNLVCIPPVPRAEPGSPARARSSGVISPTSGIRAACSSFLGSVVYSPSMSLRRMSRSAPTHSATIAARVSFSPMVVDSPTSSVATASFSLTMGRAFSSSSRSMALTKFCRRWGKRTSSPVSRSWATVWLYWANSLS